MDVKALGQRLRELRGERSKDDVVRTIEAKQGFRMSQEALRVLERGVVESPGFTILDALAREYGTTVEYIVCGVRDEPLRAAKA